MPKKVLIITYYWPPAGGPGVQRWLKFVKYLPNFDVEPIVFIPKNPNYPIVDESLLSEILNDVTILKHPIKEPYKWANILSKNRSNTISKGIISEQKKQSIVESIMLYIRGNFFIPDARVGWVSSSVKYLSKYIKEEGINTIITTGPPHSLHLIGLKLKTQCQQLKWLTDFRDPWTTIGYHSQLKLTKRSQKKHVYLEKCVLEQSDQIIVTSFKTKAEFKGKTNTPIEVITNGYDDDYTGIPNLDSKFTISHIGSLLSKRNPEVLWRILERITKIHPTFRHDFQLNLIGTVSQTVLDTLHKFNLLSYANLLGYVSHNQCLAYQRSAQVLLLIEIDAKETQCIIPGKLFEYLHAKRPIIAIGPKDSDVAHIISETKSGYYFNYQDEIELEQTILKHYEAFKTKTLSISPVGIEAYHRKTLTKSLTKLL